MKNSNVSLLIREYNNSDIEGVLQLWKECNLLFPGNDPVKDIELKVAFQPELFLVGVSENEIAATLMAGYDGHRGWLNYLGVLPQYQRQGYASQMIDHAIIILKNLGCPKINLQVRNNNIGVIEFYKKIGFYEHEVVSMQRKL